MTKCKWCDTKIMFQKVEGKWLPFNLNKRPHRCENYRNRNCEKCGHVYEFVDGEPKLYHECKRTKQIREPKRTKEEIEKERYSSTFQHLENEDQVKRILGIK